MNNATQTAPAAAAATPRGEGLARAHVGGLNCPRCAGTVDLELGRRVATCPFCHTPLLVVGEAGIERLAVRPQVAGEQARTNVSGWLGKGWHKDPTLRREARQREAFLCFVPFYRISADVLGVALGTERRTRTVGSGKNRRTEVYYVDVERRVEAQCSRVVPAVNTAEWGVASVDLAGDELVAFDADELAKAGMVFPPTSSASDAFDAALAAFEDEKDPANGLHETRFRFFDTLRERIVLVYYPLWMIRYEHRQRAYQVVIDGEDGRLVYGKAPGNDTYRAATLVGSQAAAALVLTSAVQWADEIEPMLFAAVVAAAIFFWGWHRFRWGGEVVEGSGVAASATPSLRNAAPPALRRFLGTSARG